LRARESRVITKTTEQLDAASLQLGCRLALDLENQGLILDVDQDQLELGLGKGELIL
jgi:hypothetical protein